MKTEKLISLINADETINEIQKNVFKGFVLRADHDNNEKREDTQLIEQVSNTKNISEIVLSTHEVKIYTVWGKDKWDVKYPYRAIYLDSTGVWRRVSTVSPSLDIAFLNYLEYKYLDSNSRFADFALKMLEIKIEE